MGSSTTLAWTLDGSVTTVTLDGQAQSGTSGSTTVAPRFRQSYTLVATDGKRTETRVVKVAAQGLDLIAGDLGGSGCLDGIGREARFTWPWLMASDPQGNLIVADPHFWYSVRRVTPAGVVTTLAGNPTEAGYLDGPAGSARFGQIAGLTVAPDGNIFVVDFGNQKIRKIALDGTVSTFASFVQGGSGAFQYNPALDASGNLYVSAFFKGEIQRIAPSGVATRFSTGFTYPGNLTVLPNGTLLVIETFDGTLWSVDANGARTLVPLAFDPTDAQSGYILSIQAVAADSSGGIYLSTARLGLLYRDAAGLVHTVTGWKEGRFLGGGFPFGLAWMGDRLALGVSNYGGEIATLLPGGRPASLAGWGAGGVFQEDGLGAAARFAYPRSLTLGSQGEIYVADQDASGAFAGVIRKVMPGGIVSTLRKQVGWGYLSGSGDDTHLLSLADGRVLYSSGNAIGSVTQAGDLASFLTGGTGGITGLCKDASGNIFFGEGTGMVAQTRVRKLTPTGQLSIVADVSAGVRSIAGLNVDASGKLFAADPTSQVVWSLSPTGASSRLAGVDLSPGFTDGAFGLGQMRDPRAIAPHPSGRILVCDRGNRAVRILASDGSLATLGGSPARSGVRLGSSQVSFTDPTDLAVTPEGDLIITDGCAVLRWTAPFGE
jgi:sugar lactone lactonase YvrE